MHCGYLLLSHTKPYKSFPRLCVGRRGVLAVRAFSVLSCVNLIPFKVEEWLHVSTGLVYIEIVRSTQGNNNFSWRLALEQKFFYPEHMMF